MMSALKKGLKASPFYFSLLKRLHNDLVTLTSMSKLRRGWWRSERKRGSESKLRRTTTLLNQRSREWLEVGLSISKSPMPSVRLLAFEHSLATNPNENQRSGYHPLAWQDE